MPKNTHHTQDINKHQFIKKMNEERPTQGSSIFHYTTSPGLLGILDKPSGASHPLWATNIHYLNDSSEFEIGIEIIKEAAKNLGENEQKPEKKEILNFIHKEATVLHPTTTFPIFVTSFSEENDKLSQWRAYGGETGYSIGFDFNELKNRANKAEWWLRKCIYKKDEYLDLITDIIDHTLDFFLEGKTETKEQITKVFSIKNPTEEQISELTKSLILVILTKCTPIFKHNGFEEEKEWRLISHWPLKNDQKTFDTLKKILMENTAPNAETYQEQNIKFRYGRSGIVPYTEFNLGEQNQLNTLLTSITIGPNQHPEIARNALIALCQFRGIPIPPENIQSTKIPYRSW